MRPVTRIGYDFGGSTPMRPSRTCLMAVLALGIMVLAPLSLLAETSEEVFEGLFGKEARRVFDALGRTRLVVENCTHPRSEVGLDFLPDAAESDTNRTTAYEFDAFGRLATLIAYNPKGEGNPVEPQKTRYLFATDLSRSWVAAVAYPDTSDQMSQDADKVWSITSGSDHVSMTYDRLGRKVTQTDQRNVVHAYSYDAAGRFLADAVTLPTGSAVDGSVLRIGRTYDDVGRVLSVTSYDAATGGTAVNGLAFTFDGWGNVATSAQTHTSGGTPQTVEYTFDDGATGNDAKYLRLSKIIYPNGRELFYNYPSSGVGGALSRLDNMASSATPQDADRYVQYTYLGGGTVVKATHPAVTNGLDLTYKGASSGAYDGLDRFGRVVDQKWQDNAGTPVVKDRFKYGYDRASNRTWRENSLTHGNQNLPALDEFYTYDGLQRLTNMDRGTLTGGPPYTGISGTPAKEEDYTLEALGNWAGYVKKTAGTTDLSQTRTHNAVNEITSITPANPWINPTYDDAGNMITAPKPGAEGTRIHMKYDAWNRMVEVRADNNGQPGDLIITARYDGLTRRIQKVVAGETDTTYDYYYNEGRQVLEERKTIGQGSTQTYAQYVWDGRYVHSPACRFRDSDGNGSLDETLYYTNDANFNITALIGTDGTPVERVVYDPYGKPTFYDGSWANPSATSAYANDVLYTGHRLDTETGLFYAGFRYYHPTLGKWITWDLIGYGNGFNMLEYGLSNPAMMIDPYGLDAWDDFAYLDAAKGTVSGYPPRDNRCACAIKALVLRAVDIKREDLATAIASAYPGGMKALEKNLKDVAETVKDVADKITEAQAAINKLQRGLMTASDFAKNYPNADVRALSNTLKQVSQEVGKFKAYNKEFASYAGEAGAVASKTVAAIEAVSAARNIVKAAQVSGGPVEAAKAEASILGVLSSIVPPGLSDLLNFEKEGLEAAIKMTNLVDRRLGDVNLGRWKAAAQLPPQQLQFIIYASNPFGHTWAETLVESKEPNSSLLVDYRRDCTVKIGGD